MHNVDTMVKVATLFGISLEVPTDASCPRPLSLTAATYEQVIKNADLSSIQ
jgi:hypothetical protein